jgi:hypothetical protein
MSDVTTVQSTVSVMAPAETVWGIVSDLPGMGDLSPENNGGRWLGGVKGPAVGARFRGRNANGWRRWSTTAKVTQCQTPGVFGFDVSSFGLSVSSWSYLVEPTKDGCSVTETWTDRRAGWFAAVSGVVTGVTNRPEAARVGMEATLAALRQRAEKGRTA